MKIKWGAFIVNGSGKAGGHVAARNRFGSYIRTLVTPINPKTKDQQLVRSRFTSLSQAWRSLTAAQRLAWNAAVADFKRTDIFGDLKTPSGFNLYMRLNGNLLKIAQSVIDAPPLPSRVHSFTTMSVTAAEGTAAIAVVFTDAIPVGSSVILSATPAISAGKNFVKSEFRQIDVLTSADTTPLDALAAWVAKFGSIGAAGSKIFVKVQSVDDATGQQGGSLIASAIIAA